jgi:hypothetical protein
MEKEPEVLKHGLAVYFQVEHKVLIAISYSAAGKVALKIVLANNVILFRLEYVIIECFRVC